MIRYMIRRDLKTIPSIEETLPVEGRWSLEDFVPACEITLESLGSVIEYQEVVAGYMVTKVADGSKEIRHLVINPPYRRQGFGRRLVQSLLENPRPESPMRVWTVLPETSLESQLFFRRLGFLYVQTHRGVFQGRDGYELEYWI